MIVRLDEGKEVFQVKFFKERNIVISGKFSGLKFRELFDTHCVILWLEAEETKFEPKNIMAHKVARQNPLDRYNKIVGKKIAMTRALKAIPALNLPTKRAKQNRTAFWNAFQEEFGRWN
jgi:hypothetical protein